MSNVELVLLAGYVKLPNFFQSICWYQTMLVNM